MQLPKLLDLSILEREQQLLAAKSQLAGRSQPGFAAPVAVRHLGKHAVAIFEWAAAVLEGFNVCLKDFAVSFADGSALCLLVSFQIILSFSLASMRWHVRL